MRAELETAAQVRDRGREAMQNGKKDEVMPAPKEAKKDVRDEVIVQESPARPVKSEQTQPKSDVNEASFSPQTEARKVAAYLRAAQARHMIKSGRVDAVTGKFLHRFAG